MPRTYANARGKALYGRAVGPADAWVLGEDSGIEVDALGGGPGSHSARWAESGRQHLCWNRSATRPTGGAHVGQMVAIAPRRPRGRAIGVTGRADRGRAARHGGFGYDPVFVPEGETRTVAELGDDWKPGQLAPRGRALRRCGRALAR